LACAVAFALLRLAMAVVLVVFDGRCDGDDDVTATAM
jgi:hypothetical protein